MKGKSDIKIYENQFLIYFNILSYKTIISEDKVDDLVKYIYQNTSLLGLKISGNIIATFCSEDFISRESLLDIEFLIPIDQEFKKSSVLNIRHYNALRVRINGNILEIKNMSTSIMNYISKNALNPITNFYYVFIRDENLNFINIIDIYTGLSDNIL